MAGRNNRKGNAPSAKAPIKRAARCLAVAEKGIENSRDLKRVLALLIADALWQSVPTSVANAACNATGKLLKTVELECKYGIPSHEGGEKLLQLRA